LIKQLLNLGGVIIISEFTKTLITSLIILELTQEIITDLKTIVELLEIIIDPKIITTQDQITIRDLQGGNKKLLSQKRRIKKVVQSPKKDKPSE